MAGLFGLTRTGFQGSLADFTDTEGGGESGHGGTQRSTDLPEGKSGGCLQQNSGKCQHNDSVLND